MHPAVKSLMMLPALVAMWAGLSPPRPPPAKDNVVLTQKQVFDLFRDLMIVYCKGVVLSYMVSESILLIALYYKSPSAPQIVSTLCSLNHTPSYSAMATPSLIFTAGAALTVAGGALRLWCYHTLGTLFNFVVHIADDHHLVMSGPYGLVRHPSYTAVAMILAGLAMMGLAHAGYMDQCALTSTRAMPFIRLWQAAITFTVISLFRRGPQEDKLLRETFGEEWEDYRRAVPRMFVPYIW